MKKRLFIGLRALSISAAIFAAVLGHAASAESVYSPAINSPSTFTTLKSGEKIHAIESGSGMPVVLLHGLPSSAYLWRKVVPLLGAYHHAIAPDLPGYGFSDIPANNERGLDALNLTLAQYLDGIEGGPIVLVVNDIGSLLGLNYAVTHSDRIAGIVLVEAVFQPPQDFMAQIHPDHMKFIAALQDPAFAKSITIDKPAIVDMAIQANTMTKLSEATLSNYRIAYMPGRKHFMAKREILAATFSPEGSASFAKLAAQNAAGLVKLNLPILLAKATPGYMVNDPAVKYAKANFKRLTVAQIPNAMHFVAEDQPEKLAQIILKWIDKITK